jgi:hypothetical protein
MIYYMSADLGIGKKGVLNWKWVQKILEALDTHVPGASGTSVALATRDVYQYLVKEALSPGKHPRCVTRWFNAMDDRDVVSLYPLDPKHFLVDPPIENKTNVDNPTANRHGISGYLSDRVVAKRIYDALTK